MKKFPIFNYKISNQGSERLDVYIDGVIVDAETQEIYREWFNDQTSVSFKSFRTEIIDSEIKNISITINSFGGQIGDAMAMHDFIQQLENDGYNIETIGIGMVCSAATYILSASKNSKISKNAYYMIHNVSGYAWGDVNEVEKTAKNLRKFNNNIRDFYVNLTGKSANQIEEWMNAETWFYGKEVVDNGFVKNLVSEQSPKNAINQNDWMFKNQNPLLAYNSFVPKNNEFDFKNLDMNNFKKAINDGVTNALVSLGLVAKNEKGEETPITNELLSGAINKALEGIDFEVSEEKIQNAVNKYFESGLPENIQKQLQEIINKAKPEAVNIKEDETIVDMEKRLSDVENKIVNNAGGAKPKGGEGSGGDIHNKWEFSE